MKVNVKTTKVIDIKYLQVEAGVRYWEDATVNGIKDVDGQLIPCRSGDVWNPLIDIDCGIVVNWEKGKSADIHYKICDDGRYKLLDSNNCQVDMVDGYVIDMMCPEGEGYGDYIIMKIDENGKISNWFVNLENFENIKA